MQRLERGINAFGAEDSLADLLLHVSVELVVPAYSGALTPRSTTASSSFIVAIVFQARPRGQVGRKLAELFKAGLAENPGVRISSRTKASASVRALAKSIFGMSPA